MKYILGGIIIVTTFFAATDRIYAQCTCANAGLSASGELKRSAAVFVGEVIEIKKADAVKNTHYVEFEVTFKIKTAWKIDLPEILTVSEAKEEGHSYFKEKENYLVYAYASENVLKVDTGCCGRTRRLSAATEDLENFKESGEIPARVIKAPVTDANAKPYSLNRSAN
ncbi:MAG: hypothetical protein QOC96_445 [Acidobacteriota bacterium]|jgi:hypothetical protein|nr:hypothetical protein [Acidobacteriota bacterium]